MIDEIRKTFEVNCSHFLVVKGSGNPFARAKKDRAYLKEGDYILSDARIAWQAWLACQQINDVVICGLTRNRSVKNENRTT